MLSTRWRARILVLLLGTLLGACASGPASNGTSTGGTNGPALTGDNSTSTGLAGGKLLSLSLSVNPNGKIDTSGQGFYIFLFNSLSNQIEVTDLDTFTDFIRFDGRSFDWFHRNANLPRPGFQFIQAGSLNQAGRITSDGRTLEVLLDTADPTNLLNQFIVTNQFTMHAVTTDSFQNAIVGRALDTLGAGPSLSSNSLQTMRVSKTNGILTPIPQFYPIDPLSDFITQPVLPPDFPYANFDIQRFEITLR